MKKLLAGVLVLVFVPAASASFFDDFESYATQGDMEAVWSGSLGLLDPAVGNPGQSMSHPGGTQNTHMLATPLAETAGQPIVWEFDLGEPSVEGLGNNRVTCTLDKSTWGWIEFGLYNDLVDPSDPGGPKVDGYGMRLVGNGGENWMSFPGDPTSRTGWHHMKATITADQILFEAWLAEGTDAAGNPVEAEYVTYTSTAHDGTDLIWDELKLGGPSSLSSTDPAWFDNVSITQIPEPASLSLLALGGLVVLRRRR